MVIEQTHKPSTSIRKSRKDFQKLLAWETCEKKCNKRPKRHIFNSCDQKKTHNTVSAVHLNSIVDPTTQTAQDMDVLPENSQQITHDWRE